MAPAHKESSKFKVNEKSSEWFLKRFYDVNSLGDPVKIESIKNELIFIGNDGSVVKSFTESLLRLKACFEKRNEESFQDVYSNLMLALNSDKIIISDRTTTPNLRVLYQTIFDNKLDLIKLLSDELDGDLCDDYNLCPQTPVKQRFRNLLGKRTLGIFNENGKPVSSYGLSHPESGLDKFLHGMLGVNYAPQFYNNIPYDYMDRFCSAHRLRIGTQIQQFMGKASVPGVFKNFLRSIDDNNDAKPDSINYLYINLQKTVKKEHSNGLERILEAKRTEALHAELGKIDRVAVITLPADNSSFFKDFDIHQGKALLHADDVNNFEKLHLIFDEICSSIMDNNNDFLIPDSERAKIFNGCDSREDVKNVLVILLTAASKEILGENAVLNDAMISKEQRQAIYFHFVKHTFTQFIISKLNPKFINISCKDAIDRAGVHNLWDLLCLLIENNEAMTLREFEARLNIPAILVKDRPINDHMNALINVLGHYYYHLPLNKQALIPWVEEWLKYNATYNNTAEKAFTWAYDLDSSRKDYKSSHGVYTELYIAVNSGDLQEVKRLLENISSIRVYDNDALKSDTILICAARKGNYDIFLELMKAHDIFEKKIGYFSKNPLHGLRGLHPKNMGTALNYLFAHLETQDVDTEDISKDRQTTETDLSYGFGLLSNFPFSSSTTLTMSPSTFMSSQEVDSDGSELLQRVSAANMLEQCIEVYIGSIIKTKSIRTKAIGYLREENLSYYTGQIDEDDLTPMMHLARTGNFKILIKLKDICKEHGADISKVFDLRNTHVGKTLLDYAAEFRHKEFIQVLYDITKDNTYTVYEYRLADRTASKAILRDSLNRHGLQ